MCNPLYLTPWQSVPWDTYAWKLVSEPNDFSIGLRAVTPEMHLCSLYSPGCRLSWLGPEKSSYLVNKPCGDLLTYQLGQPTRNPSGAPGIMLYGSLASAAEKAEGISLLHHKAILLVKIPAGTQYRLSREGGIDRPFLLAREVIPVEGWALEQIFTDPARLRLRLAAARGDILHA